MKGEVVNLNRERWLALANQALDGAATLDAGKVEALGRMAGGMQAATPPATARVAMAGCLTFRWACQHFAFVDPGARPGLAGALTAYAWEIRRIFEHTAPPREAAAMPVPVEADLEPAVADPPRWAQRLDIGG